MVALETCGIRHAGLLPGVLKHNSRSQWGFREGWQVLSGCTRGWKGSASEMASGTDKGWRGELGAACEQQGTRAINLLYVPSMACRRPDCVGGRRWLRHTWDKASRV